ncbi:MAG TPA: CAP domain-containing protein [Syntrophorhabdaceae bacterium]|nr:CAP domain-containing protein [Syntrophorhabdaceae bacterium]
MRLKGYTILGIAVVLIPCLIAYILFVRHSRAPSDDTLKPPIEALPPPIREPLNSDVMFHLTNTARSLNGLPALSANQQLNAIADIRAKDMLAQQYFAHLSPSGEQASDVAQRVGYKYSIIAENIAMGYFLTNLEIIDGWMGSPGHRKNILSLDVKELGIAVVAGTMKGRETWIAVQIFGLPLSLLPECKIPSRELADGIKMKRIEVDDLNDGLKKQRKELDDERNAIEEEHRSPSPRISSNERTLNVRISDYNEKTVQYNARIADLKARLQVLQSMITDYNDMVQAYDSCRGKQ